MIVIRREDLKRIIDAAEAAYPEEACGLLAGIDRGADGILVTAVHASANVAAEPRRRFEIDPRLRLDLQRALRETGERIVGHYHSHPDHSAQPSATDLEGAWEPGLAWLVIAVAGGQAIHTTAHVLAADAARFRELALRTTDWRPEPERPPPGF